MRGKKETGLEGENMAKQYLKQKGYEIRETNWRFRRAEVDLIAMDENILVFVEVKTRSYDFFGKPESFVSKTKEKLLIDAANRYMEQIGHDWEIRFDVVGIVVSTRKMTEIRHIKDAFWGGI